MAYQPIYDASVANVNNLAQPVYNALAAYQKRTELEANRQIERDKLAAEQDYRGAQLGMQNKRLALDERTTNAQLAASRQNMDLSRQRFGLEQRRFGREEDDYKSRKLTELYTRGAGLAQLITQDQDPASAAQKWQRLVRSDPRWGQMLSAAGIDPSDYQAGTSHIIGLARGYREPAPAQPKVNVIPQGGALAVTNPNTGKTIITHTGEGNKADSKFVEAAATSQVARYDDVVKQGSNQQAAIGTVRTLRTLSDKIGAPGVGNTVARTLGPAMRNFGVEVGNLSDMEAFNAIISRLVPTQRPPGSGTMSDKDVDLFKQSLPQLSATAAGRKLILDQMEAIAQYDIRRSQIASRALNGEIPRQTAEKMLRNLPDPMELFRQATAANAPTGNGSGASGGGGGPRYVNPQTGEVITWNGSSYVNAQGIPISDAQGVPYPPASR